VARRLLNRQIRQIDARLAPFALVLALGAGGCRHGDRAPGPSPAIARSSSAFADSARALHFAKEKMRASERWRSKPVLTDCTIVLHESGDAELCSGATSALGSFEQLDLDAPNAQLLAVLGDGSLALARLSQRARYQALKDLGQKRLTGDAGAPSPSPAASTPTTPSGQAMPEKQALGGRMPREERAMELTQGPASQLLSIVLRLERDSLRNLGAYLEYAPLSTRQTAFDTVKHLREVHPQWPLLEHLIREAALLEIDPDLKSALSALAASGLPRSKRLGQPASGQPADSK
jgi:hypothetical protein